jgi:Rrf2 family iron-sulfur cluster assembly transcriptional regulator
MLSFSQTAGYAVLALGCIGSWKGDWVLSKQVHKCTGIPMPYLRKILFALGKAGLIVAKRGYQGGFVLARPPQEISLLEVVRAVEHDKPGVDCLLGLAGCCDATPCPLRGFWQKERARIDTRLARTSLVKAAESIRAARWGKLTVCPPPDYVPKRARARQTVRPARRRGASCTARRKKAPPARCKRT